MWAFRLSPRRRRGVVRATLPQPRFVPCVRDDPAKPRQFTIRGITHSGKTFRPSDWSERLAGALSSFRPGQQRHHGAHRLLAAVRAARRRRRQVRDRQRGTARRRADGVGLRDALRARQRPALRRGRPSARRAGKQAAMAGLWLGKVGPPLRRSSPTLADSGSCGAPPCSCHLCRRSSRSPAAVLNNRRPLALSPASTAFCTFLTTVRNFERSAVFAALSFDVLADTLQTRRDADGLLGFGRGGHAFGAF